MSGSARRLCAALALPVLSGVGAGAQVPTRSRRIVRWREQGIAASPEPVAWRRQPAN